MAYPLNKSPSLAIYLPDFHGGGVERVTLTLVRSFLKRGLDVRVIVHRVTGQLQDELPEGVRIVSLDTYRTLGALFKLSRHLRRDPPDILLSNLGHTNIVALWARGLARLGRKSPTRVVICQHNALSSEVKNMPGWQYRVLPVLYRLFGGWAEGIVGVSNGVCDDLSALTGIHRGRMTTLYNPVIDGRFEDQLCEQSPRGVFSKNDPWTILGMGRLVPQKDFSTLLRAFALIPGEHVRLVIAGCGPQHGELQTLAEELNVSARVKFLGFVSNPVKLLCSAQVFALSSRYEGLGNVLVEALACGLPVVSTRCPHGPSEVLQNGEFGLLVPVGSPDALAQAICRQRERPVCDVMKGKSRARAFHVDEVTDRYLELFGKVL